MEILFLIIAGFFKAVSDTLTHHYDTSIFKWKDARFWNPAISWQFAHYLKFTKYKLDAWHISNSGMIIFFSLAVVFHHPHLKWYYEILLAGSLFNLSFNIFYNHILRK